MLSYVSFHYYTVSISDIDKEIEGLQLEEEDIDMEEGPHIIDTKGKNNDDLDESALENDDGSIMSAIPFDNQVIPTDAKPVLQAAFSRVGRDMIKMNKLREMFKDSIFIDGEGRQVMDINDAMNMISTADALGALPRSQFIENSHGLNNNKNDKRKTSNCRKAVDSHNAAQQQQQQYNNNRNKPTFNDNNTS